MEGRAVGVYNNKEKNRDEINGCAPSHHSSRFTEERGKLLRKPGHRCRGTSKTPGGEQ